MTVLDFALKTAKEIGKERKRAHLLDKKREFCLVHGVCPDCGLQKIEHRERDAGDSYYCYSSLCAKTGFFGHIKSKYKGTY